MAAAVVVKPAAPGAFTFLKHGVLLPARGCGLFVQVFALDAALSLPLLLFKHLAVGPITTEDSFPLCAGGALIVLSVAATAVTRVAAASAAVASYSGERHYTFASLSFLRRVARDLPRGAATVAAGWALRAACATPAVVAALLPPVLVFWADVSPWLLLLDALFVILASLFLAYLAVVCAVAVVVSAAEPGRRGTAVARAWRLMRGTGARAVVYVAATWAVWAAAAGVGTLAVGWLPPQAAGRVVVGAAVRHVLDHVVKVFSVTAAAGYYFDCRRSKEEDKAGHVD